MPDPAKIAALRQANYVVQPSCGTCRYFSDLGLQWGRCTKITHVHEKHGQRAATGVRKDGVCPMFSFDPIKKGLLEASGYGVLLGPVHGCEDCRADHP